jgi:5-methylcytosine-specific restriction endonuclease McrA
MRVRDHIALSSTGAALVQPWLRRGAIGFWAGGVLVDVDHYAWVCVRKRLWSPRAAMRFFNEAHPPQHRETRVLHSPVVPLALLVAALRRPALVAVAAGVAVHLALDVHHQTRMDAARAVALERDGFSCQACGSHAPGIGTHLQGQPWLMPSYQPHNLVALCESCHETAHAARSRSWN